METDATQATARANAQVLHALDFGNRRDFEELPGYLREGINVHFARTYREVFEYVFHEHRTDKSLH